LKLTPQTIKLLLVTSPSRPGYRPAALLAICAAILVSALAVLPLALAAQKTGKAMAKNDIIGLLEAGVDSAKVGDAAQDFGITFEMNAETEAQLRDLGADDKLIALLKRIAPKGPTTTRPKPTPPPVASPPVLMVEVTPGGAQVYVDDEPVGTTSQSGRLKLSQLQPGAHTVRVSHAGYSDLEQSVNLAAGETANVSATLQGIPAPVTPNPVTPSGDSRNPLAGGGGAQGSATGEPGSLGVMVARETPGGGQGAYITAVAPSSPAEQAGLRPGHTVVSVNGQAISTPQALLEMINRAHAGDYLQIAYNDGSRVQWTRARLAPRSSIVPPPAQNLPPSAGSLVGGVTNPGVTPPQNTQPALPTVTYNALHDHGSGGQDYCSGVLTIGGGRILYRGNNTAHTFNFGLDEVKEAKKNGVYLVALGAFHIRLKSGPNYNFVVVGPGGQHQSPDEVLRVIGMSMGHN
jgi:hypothetical protein